MENSLTVLREFHVELPQNLEIQLLGIYLKEL